MQILQYCLFLEKNLITRSNDFEMATGNNRGIVGYASRVKRRDAVELDRKTVSIPTTLLNNPITDYCTRPKKIMFILQKSDNENTYKKLFYEIKKGLFEVEKELFSEELKMLMNI